MPSRQDEQSGQRSGALEVLAPNGVGEVVAGEDLAELLIRHAHLMDGDIVVVTSKVVSKAEGRVRQGDAATSLAEETQRVVARTGSVTIARGRLGVTQAMAGLDTSNVSVGSHILLPLDPDASARALRERVWAARGVNIAVLVSDTAGRAWRIGQTEIAIGAAGLVVLESYLGKVDSYGNVLRLTEPCVADELCSAAELVSGKTTRRPFAIIRGRADLVCVPEVIGDGAATLVRPPAQDLFGFGAREAVLRAVAAWPADAAAFGEPSPASELARALVAALADPADASEVPPRVTAYGDEVLVDGAEPTRAMQAVAFAHGWVVDSHDARRIRLVRISP